jgi:hypothetical protein
MMQTPMKNKTKRKQSRTTISLPKALFEKGITRALTIRPYTFSNYVASLIEKDAEKAEKAFAAKWSWLPKSCHNHHRIHHIWIIHGMSIREPERADF